MERVTSGGGPAGVILTDLEKWFGSNIERETQLSEEYLYWSSSHTYQNSNLLIYNEKWTVR